MRNYFCSVSYRKIVGADSISARYNIVVLYPQNTVGDGFPVLRRKAFLTNSELFLLRNYRKVFHNKRMSLFSSDKPVENRDVLLLFLFWGRHFRTPKNRFAIRDGKPVPYRICRVKYRFFASVGYRIRPYGIRCFAVNLQNTINSELIFCFVLFS